MRIVVTAFGLLVLASWVDARPSAAQTFRHYPWCLDYFGVDGSTTNCGFVTYQQCAMTRNGAGGICYENPAYQPATTPPPRARRR
jgi:Protein of unknown function (DUF3551)